MARLTLALVLIMLIIGCDNSNLILAKNGDEKKPDSDQVKVGQ